MRALKPFPRLKSAERNMCEAPVKINKFQMLMNLICRALKIFKGAFLTNEGFKRPRNLEIIPKTVYKSIHASSNDIKFHNVLFFCFNLRCKTS